MDLDLATIAAQLEGLEETIIAKLIDRAQFRLNSAVYERGKSGFNDRVDRSLFELRLYYQEQMDALFGRYKVAEERPFSKTLPAPRRTVDLPPTGLVMSVIEAVNLTAEIGASYFPLLEKICREGDDGHYGSSVEHDVYCLQAIARRIHFGSLYVAECKYQSDPEGYAAIIEKGDRDSLLEKLTRVEVEERIISRVRQKVEYMQAKADERVRIVIDPEVIVQYYHDTIIPLTKKGETIYLLQRKDAERL
jgi:chorismate mutase